MIRTFRFKLKPSSAQHRRLRDALERSRQLYNAALAERIDCYRKTKKTLTFYSQCMALTELRADGTPYSATMERGPLLAVDRAFKAFFKSGKGFPRFKGKHWFKSIAWADRLGWQFGDSVFFAKGIGRIRSHQYRALPSKPVSAKIKREGRSWYLLLGCEIEAAPDNEDGPAVGLDLGLSSFAALSNGTLIANPRRSRKGQAEIRRRQRALARCKKGSKRRRKVREQLTKAHAAIRRARRTHHFQVAAKLVSGFSLIAVEDLNVEGLARSRLARDVNDAAWGGFLQILSDKAESAGRKVVKVDPRHTSQTCPECGTVEPKSLSERIHRCACGYKADRDVAAAQVILHRAVRGPGAANVGGYVERSRGKVAA
jgi:putative transposase